MKNVLILGAGLVSRPIVRYLLARTDRTIVVASRTVGKAEALIAGHPRGKAVAVNVDNEAQVETLVKEAEIVVSLVPLRHLIGGKLDCFSCAVAGGPRRKAWGIVGLLNEHHMGWAWISLFAVCFADFYVRMCSMGVISDPMLVTFRNLFDAAPLP